MASHALVSRSDRRNIEREGLGLGNCIGENGSAVEDDDIAPPTNLRQRSRYFSSIREHKYECLPFLGRSRSVACNGLQTAGGGVRRIRLLDFCLHILRGESFQCDLQLTSGFEAEEGRCVI